MRATSTTPLMNALCHETWRGRVRKRTLPAGEVSPAVRQLSNHDYVVPESRAQNHPGLSIIAPAGDRFS
jgi:hypothetical protein